MSIANDPNAKLVQLGDQEFPNGGRPAESARERAERLLRQEHEARQKKADLGVLLDSKAAPETQRMQQVVTEQMRAGANGAMQAHKVHETENRYYLVSVGNRFLSTRADRPAIKGRLGGFSSLKKALVGRDEVYAKDESTRVYILRRGWNLIGKRPFEMIDAGETKKEMKTLIENRDNLLHGLLGASIFEYSTKKVRLEKRNKAVKEHAESAGKVTSTEGNDDIQPVDYYTHDTDGKPMQAVESIASKISASIPKEEEQEDKDENSGEDNEDESKTEDATATSVEDAVDAPGVENGSNTGDAINNGDTGSSSSSNDIVQQKDDFEGKRVYAGTDEEIGLAPQPSWMVLAYAWSKAQKHNGRPALLIYDVVDSEKIANEIAEKCRNKNPLFTHMVMPMGEWKCIPFEEGEAVQSKYHDERVGRYMGDLKSSRANGAQSVQNERAEFEKMAASRMQWKRQITGGMEAGMSDSEGEPDVAGNDAPVDYNPLNTRVEDEAPDEELDPMQHAQRDRRRLFDETLKQAHRSKTRLTRNISARNKKT